MGKGIFQIGVKYAVDGLIKGLTGNVLTHFIVSGTVIVAGWYCGITTHEWLWIIMCITAVMAMEYMNTAVEQLCDHLHPDRHPMIANVKDLAAGAVLVTCIGAVIIGIIIFYPYVTELITS